MRLKENGKDFRCNICQNNYFSKSTLNTQEKTNFVGLFVFALSTLPPHNWIDAALVLGDLMQALVGDCAHDALVDNQITLKGIVYDAEQNHITVTAKYSIATVDIVLMPVQLYKNEEKSTFEKSTFEKSGVKTYREGGLRGRCSSV